jgi:hypothetical protein
VNQDFLKEPAPATPGSGRAAYGGGVSKQGGRGRRRLAPRVALVVLLALGVPPLGGCGGPEPPDRLLIASGNQGGVYYALGGALADAARQRWDARAENLETAASVENVHLLAAGQVDVAIVVADVVAAAVDGTAPFRAPVPLAALCRLHDDYVQLVVRAGSPVARLADLRGVRVSTGSRDSGTEMLADRILRAGGLDPDRDLDRRRMGLGDAVRALREDLIDAFFFSGGLPTPAIAELARDTPIRLIPLVEYVQPLRDGYGELYTARSVPATTYELPDEVETVGVGNLLVVRADLPDPTAYAITRLLFDAQPDLVAAHREAHRINRQAGVATFPVTLHPGAADYFRDTKRF